MHLKTYDVDFLLILAHFGGELQVHFFLLTQACTSVFDIHEIHISHPRLSLGKHQMHKADLM